MSANANCPHSEGRKADSVSADQRKQIIPYPIATEGAASRRVKRGFCHHTRHCAVKSAFHPAPIGAVITFADASRWKWSAGLLVLHALRYESACQEETGDKNLDGSHLEGAICRPKVPQHFMVLRPVKARVTISLPSGEQLARSSNAVRLIEVGKTLYDPVIYLPRDDVLVDLEREEKSTHCPLKGDASYHTVTTSQGTIPSIAWSYDAPLEFAKALAGLVAFYPNLVVIEEQGLG